MAALINFLFIIVDVLVQAVIWLIIAEVIVSWLVAFGVINMRNHLANQVVRMLESATRPILRPVRRIIPPLGGLDISPMIVIVVLGAAERALLPPLHDWLLSLVG